MSTSRVPRGLLLLGIAEAPAPEDSLIWALLEQSVRQINRRVPPNSPAPALEPLKLRSLSRHVAGPIEQSQRTVVLTGAEPGHFGNRSWAHQRLTAGEKLEGPLLVITHDPLILPVFSDATGSDPMTDLKTADGDDQASLASPDAMGFTVEVERREDEVSDPEELMHSPPRWLVAGLPPGGLDLVTLALPARGGLAWVLPQMGIWFPETVQRLSDLLWEIRREISIPGLVGGDPGAVA